MKMPLQPLTAILTAVAVAVLLIPPAASASAAANNCPPSAYSLIPLDKSNGAPEAQDAACLDGSAPMMHFRPGKRADTRKVLVYLQGGGWCQSSGQCYNRSIGQGGQSGDLGSSKHYPACAQMVDFYEGGEGLREANDSVSAWADWAEAYFHCEL
eukprot:SAG11_NODE_1200_length_5538_cov_8.582460_4_plen_155_part_00